MARADVQLHHPSAFCTLHEVGQAMIKAATRGCRKPILEAKDIVALAASFRA